MGFVPVPDKAWRKYHSPTANSLLYPLLHKLNGWAAGGLFEIRAGFFNFFFLSRVHPPRAVAHSNPNRSGSNTIKEKTSWWSWSGREHSWVGQSCPGCQSTNAASWLLAGWHLDGARAKSRGGGRAENSSPKSVLQQSCCPFLVEVDFKVSVVVVFLPLHTLFSVSFPTATLKFSSLYIFLPKKQDQTGRLLLSVHYYSFQAMAGWQ